MITKQDVGSRVIVTLIDGTMTEGWLDRLQKRGPMMTGIVRTDMNDEIVAEIRYIRVI